MAHRQQPTFEQCRRAVNTIGKVHSDNILKVWEDAAAERFYQRAQDEAFEVDASDIYEWRRSAERQFARQPSTEHLAELLEVMALKWSPGHYYDELVDALPDLVRRVEQGAPTEG